MLIRVLNPASPEAVNLLWLWDVCMWICGLILAVVTGSLIYILIRFRRRDDREPDQHTGNRKLEILWTAVPIVLVGCLFVLSVLTARAVDRPAARTADIVVTGHQWWWEVSYPAAKVTTANEVHLPVGRDMLIEIDAADVIHDFWVPQLGRKIDAVPGRRNVVWIRADKAGTYYGACAEYCGAQHAWMRFRAIAQDKPSFAAWLAAQSAPSVAPDSADAEFGRTRFTQLTCANCHNIRGVNSQEQYAPDLTHVGSRRMLAGERIANTSANLRDWLHEPNIVKPDCLMPNLNLSDRDLDVLTAYLESLK